MTDVTAVAAREVAAQSREAARVQQDNVRRDREAAAQAAARDAAPPPPPRDSGRGANVDERA